MKLSSNKQLLVVAGVCLLIIIAVKVWLEKYSTSSNPDQIRANNAQQITINHCDFSTACHVGFDNKKIIIAINKPIVLLKSFDVNVSLDTAAPGNDSQMQPVLAKFSMRGMNMGTNQFQFKKIQQNKWQATVLLPICSQGRSDWLMEISMEADKRTVYKLMFPITASPR